ncbi:MAG: lipopolysaccharide assembly protein LapB [Gammaproteobacteria bacterium]|nr:lipopolysaccharide assembly protein LapB [Gammaproteobacteria bacterium]
MTPFDLLWLLLPVAAGSGWLVGRFGPRARASQGGDDDLRSNYFKGINYLLNEQPDKAIEAFIKVLEVDSETVETHLALGNLYRRRGEVDRAIRIHQNLIARPGLVENQRAEAVLELGQDYLSAGLLDRAENLLKELADDGIYRVQALRQLIDIYEQEKDWERAIECARELRKATGNQLGPVIAHYHCERAERFRHKNDAEAALGSVKEALEAHQGCVRASLLEGDIHTDLGEYESAVEAYKRVEEQDADYVPEIIGRMRYCFRALDRGDEMDTYLTRLMERYGWITPMLALAELKRERHGTATAIEFMSEQLKHRSSVRGLDRLLQLELQENGNGHTQHVTMLKSLTSDLLADRPVYKCSHCGFPGKLLHWQCPSCKHWNTIKPIQGVEGE